MYFLGRVSDYFVVLSKKLQNKIYYKLAFSFLFYFSKISKWRATKANDLSKLSDQVKKATNKS